MREFSVREIPYAYVGKHCEVVDSRNKVVFPPLSDRRTYTPAKGLLVLLGTNRDACLGFIAGYEFAYEEKA